ncbi:MAG: FAD-dependent oxidoreductase, partial [Pirellulaceae bacterium]|nr:FAD-dependent oxidoreductase [Pirellulaceae bacterium]
EESQIRNPWHLQALKQSCLNQGVRFLENQGQSRFTLQGSHVAKLQTEMGNEISANRFCVTAGAWTAQLAQPLGVQISTVPVRGQMLLFKLPEPVFTPVIYEGTRYIVAREDGHVVVGSTLEEAGFNNSTTESGIKSLLDFASGLVPELNESCLVQSWAGLRPASFDGFPYMGPAPHLDNLWMATAHFRSGLLLSTGTAKLMSQLLCDEQPLFDLSPFRIDRG